MTVAPTCNALLTKLRNAVLRGKPWQHRHRALVIIDGNKAEQTLDGQFAAIATHAFDIHLNLNLETGVADFNHSPHQLNDATRGNGVVEVNAIGRHRHQRQTTKTGGGDKRYLVHPGQRSAAKQGVVVIGGRWENRFGNTGNGQFSTTLNLLLTQSHAFTTYNWTKV